MEKRKRLHLGFMDAEWRTIYCGIDGEGEERMAPSQRAAKEGRDHAMTDDSVAND